ncbi:hypothetical protein MYCTH_2126987 [Thermothelomyces thermophilus ATCC 42464]|uniref:Nnf1-domain-containing protein n=1 Tax=Thermothelomyces thermophilus (strain ATCC 42464 / BCRC 31852 / DSM 1799) TaxID=573729 RepID=G2QBM3_THET4|nr:uncharacterized protein MYCTH_2126987 [Thermothelomyces thermophilus ATCC 42464]AEO57966.1 hypothetical protein MYCTH_2126987 [Thermothelomyces thermophilus ATCC 42464]
MPSSEQHPPRPRQQPQEPADTDMPDQPPPQPQPSTATTSAASAEHEQQQRSLQTESREGQGQGVGEGAAGRGKQQQQPPPPQPQQQQQQTSPAQPAPPPPPPPPPVPGPRAARLQALFATTAKHTLDKINKDNFGACFPTISQKAPGTLEFVQRQMVERLGSLWNVTKGERDGTVTTTTGEEGGTALLTDDENPHPPSPVVVAGLGPRPIDRCTTAKANKKGWEHPAQKEFETIMANRQVVERLNELEALVSDAARRRMEADDPNKPPVAPHTLPAETILSAHLHPHLASHRSQLNARLQNTQAANARLWDEIQAQRAEMEALVAGVEEALRDLDGANDLLGDLVDELAAETRAAEADIRAVRGPG